ncbi:MerR family transcriptional regulator [Halalkalibacter oceani]|uniref:MerR family transcriptional regulator n=1 Tax=Halalkalibacter oceani TaxID=1653776 RepID=A0A9X2DPL3_9BACI|nr:MerR family transcriptional regulator [Halalkalibacter oceani]MCM3714123.1 MerR family transcriptional regulator [Halalkalibacter oceani]
MISIQVLTKQTGMTVRTLRYYDQIGLVKPSSRTEGGHRLYSEDDVKKLQQVEFLKAVGFRLQEIQDMLTEPKWNWSAGLNKQMSYVQEERRKLDKMEASLRGLMHTHVMEGEVSMEMLEQLITLSRREKAQKKHFRETYFNEHEDTLWERLPNVNRDDPDSLEWIGLLGQLKKVQGDGPEAVSVQRIIRRMAEKLEDTFGDEPLFLERLWEVRKSPEQSNQVQFYPLEPSFLDFIEAAYVVYERDQGKDSNERSR